MDLSDCIGTLMIGGNWASSHQQRSSWLPIIMAEVCILPFNDWSKQSKRFCLVVNAQNKFTAFRPYTYIWCEVRRCNCKCNWLWRISRLHVDVARINWVFLFGYVYPTRSSNVVGKLKPKPKNPLALRLEKNSETRTRCHYHPKIPSIKYVLTDQLTHSTSDWTRFSSVALSCPNSNRS